MTGQLLQVPIQLRRGSRAQVLAHVPVLPGEPLLATDTFEVFFGFGAAITPLKVDYSNILNVPPFSVDWADVTNKPSTTVLQYYCTGVGQKNSTSPITWSAPLITQGVEVITIVFTPKKIGSTITIKALGGFQGTGNSTRGYSLFKNGTNLTGSCSYGLANTTVSVQIMLSMITSSLDPMTVQLRAGSDVSSSLTNWGTSIEIIEIE